MALMTMTYIGHNYDIETFVDKVGVIDILKSPSLKNIKCHPADKMMRRWNMPGEYCVTE